MSKETTSSSTPTPLGLFYTLTREEAAAYLTDTRSKYALVASRWREATTNELLAAAVVEQERAKIADQGQKQGHPPSMIASDQAKFTRDGWFELCAKKASAFEESLGLIDRQIKHLGAGPFDLNLEQLAQITPDSLQVDAMGPPKQPMLIKN